MPAPVLLMDGLGINVVNDWEGRAPAAVFAEPAALGRPPAGVDWIAPGLGN